MFRDHSGILSVAASLVLKEPTKIITISLLQQKETSA